MSEGLNIHSANCSWQNMLSDSSQSSAGWMVRFCINMLHYYLLFLIYFYFSTKLATQQVVLEINKLPHTFPHILKHTCAYTCAQTHTTHTEKSLFFSTTINRCVLREDLAYCLFFIRHYGRFCGEMSFTKGLWNDISVELLCFVWSKANSQTLDITFLT